MANHHFGWIVASDDEQEAILHHASGAQTIITLTAGEGVFTVRLPEFGYKYWVEGGPMNDPWPVAREQAERWADKMWPPRTRIRPTA